MLKCIVSSTLEVTSTKALLKMYNVQIMFYIHTDNAVSISVCYNNKKCVNTVYKYGYDEYFIVNSAVVNCRLLDSAY